MSFFFFATFFIQDFFKFLLTLQIFYQDIQSVTGRIMDYRLRELHRIYTGMIGELWEVFIQKSEIKFHIMSDDDGIWTKKFLNIMCYDISLRSIVEVFDTQSRDEVDDMFEFVSFFVWFDQRFVCLDDLTLSI